MAPLRGGRHGDWVFLHVVTLVIEQGWVNFGPKNPDVYNFLVP